MLIHSFACSAAASASEIIVMRLLPAALPMELPADVTCKEVPPAATVPSIRPVCPQKNFGDLKGHFWGSYNWSCQGLQRDTACTFGCLLLQSWLEHVLQVENLLESLNKHLSTNVQCIPRLCHSILCNLLRNPNFFEDTCTQATCSWNLLLQAS